MKFIFCTFFIFLISLMALSNDSFKEGKRLLQTSKFEAANDYFSELLSHKKDFKDTSLAYIYAYRARTFQLMQKYEPSLRDFQISLKIFEINNHINGKAHVFIRLVEFYRCLHDFEKANFYLKKLKLLNDDDLLTKNNQAHYYNRLAAIITETTRNKDDVIKYSELAIVLAKEIGDKEIEASSLNELGFVYQNMNSPKSFEYYGQSLELYKELNNQRYVLGVIVNLARNYHDITDYEKSLFYCDMGLKMVENEDWNIIKRDLYFYKARAYDYLHKYKLALSAQQHYYEYSGRVEQLMSDKSLKELEVKYGVVEKDNQILLEQEKTKLLKQETLAKTKRINTIILVSFLLSLLSFVAVFGYYKVKRANRLLNHSISQKEVLLQEVHHRVKNNLTLLNSLLYLRAKASDDDKIKLVLNECQSRVQAMALVHKNLYDVDDASKVDFNKFLKQLTNESKVLFNCNNKVNTFYETNEISFEMGFAIFLGLIINEFITNSLKYAFDEDKENTISINLSKSKKEYTLTYFDSGKGLPLNFELDKSGGFGFKLINIMVKQIDGSLTYNNNTFTLHFTL